MGDVTIATMSQQVAAIQREIEVFERLECANLNTLNALRTHTAPSR